MKIKARKMRHGFTLIELLIATVGVLVVAVVIFVVCKLVMFVASL